MTPNQLAMVFVCAVATAGIFWQRKEVGFAPHEDQKVNGTVSISSKHFVLLDNNDNQQSTCSTAQRRALARQNATEAQWKKMTFCLVHEQVHTKLGQFFFHISKCGGTSVAQWMKNMGCFRHGNPRGKDHSHTVAELGFDAQWYTEHRIEELGYNLYYFPRWFYVHPEKVQGTSCQDMEAYLQDKHRTGIASEAVIPFQNGNDWGSGGCPTMINSMSFREPLARIESHYRHLTNGKTRPSPREFFREGSDKLDVRVMSKVYHMISDNYYTRSFVGHGFFEWEPNDTIPSLNQHPLAWTKLFPAANQSLHNMDWIALMGKEDTTEMEEDQNRNEIFQYGTGWGLNSSMGLLRSNGKRNETLLSDPEYLRNLNSLDYKLWEEAKELNRLDVISIQRMKPYYADAVAAAMSTKPQGVKDICCGLVCHPISNKQVGGKTKDNMRQFLQSELSSHLDHEKAQRNYSLHPHIHVKRNSSAKRHYSLHSNTPVEKRDSMPE